MAMERTFSIIKPDAVAKILSVKSSRDSAAGLGIVASRMERLSVEKAKDFMQNTKVRLL